MVDLVNIGLGVLLYIIIIELYNSIKKTYGCSDYISTEYRMVNDEYCYLLIFTGTGRIKINCIKQLDPPQYVEKYRYTPRELITDTILDKEHPIILGVLTPIDDTYPSTFIDIYIDGEFTFFAY